MKSGNDSIQEWGDGRRANDDRPVYQVSAQYEIDDSRQQAVRAGSGVGSSTLREGVRGMPRAGITEVLIALGHNAEARIAVCWRNPFGGVFKASTMPGVEVESFCSTKSTSYDVWFSPNATLCADPGRKGTARQVAGLRVLPIDLDAKFNGLFDVDTCEKVKEVISNELGVEPTVTIYSGHGIQPLWTVEPQPTATDEDYAEAVAFVDRWGLYVADVAEEFGGKVDDVFNLDRLQRMPGTFNWKDSDEPVEATAVVSEMARPLTRVDLDAAFNKRGIPEVAPRPVSRGDESREHGDWQWAPTTCAYALGALQDWLGDETRDSRHNWLGYRLTKLHAFRRNGCLAEDDFEAAFEQLAEEFDSRKGVDEQSFREFDSWDDWGQAKVESMTEEELAEELGGHTHDWGFDLRDNKWRSGKPKLGEGTLEETFASEITPRRTRWAWENTYVSNALGILAGPEGLGKSTLAYWMIARLTRGDLPGEWLGTPRHCIIIASEDTWAETIVPRLIAADADLDLVSKVKKRTTETSFGDVSLPDDIPALEKLIRKRETALILLDPLLARIDGRIDTHKDAEVRIALGPLKDLAEKCAVSIVGIMHLNKSKSTDPSRALMASRAFSAVARSTAYVLRDSEAKHGRLFGGHKNNVGPDGQAMRRFTIENRVLDEHSDPDDGTAISTGALVWGEWSDDTVEDAFRKHSEDRVDPSATDEAVAWLEDFLAEVGGCMLRRDLQVKWRANGFSDKVARSARERSTVCTVNTQTVPRQTFWRLKDHSCDRCAPSAASAAKQHEASEVGPNACDAPGPGEVSLGTTGLERARLECEVTVAPVVPNKSVPQREGTTDWDDEEVVSEDWYETNIGCLQRRDPA